ncbi:hypothetical protein [Actinospica robiniae]|uniref:hypothetical protein n=1 Tax=Actinospica robiniae TaxID=304901 RepID=UPI0005554698|nr:hypothetical protein [Actinospica robiniae]
MYRQGDVLIVPVPGTAQETPSAIAAEIARLEPAARDGRGRMVLALGESTGHAHAVVGKGALYRGRTELAPMHLHLPQGGRVVHEEHAAFALPPGWYRVIRQREYEPGSVRIVAD